MKRPAFQFYPADWRNNAKLRRCSPAARGAWMDILCLLHDADEYGVLRWPLADIAQAAGIAMKLARELADKGVLKGADQGAAPYVFTPRHAGKNGDPVMLVEAKDGPCWYCSRFARDEYVRQQRGGDTRFTGSPKTAPKVAPKPYIGDGLGDGSTSSSSSSKDQEQELPPTAGKEPPDPIFGTGLAMLMRKGVPEKPARSFLGKFRRDVGDDLKASALLAKAETDDISEPLAWLAKAAKARASTTTGIAQQFADKTYTGTPDDELPDYLRPH